uniref:LysM and putative peptidoglycan-binding domain-containing protein 4 n=1 Tax=Monopterus albus TaxID=43700 RepID=A0A3Q3QEJ4_MONAL
MRRVEHVPQAFEAPVDVHASADGQVYMFNRRLNQAAVSSDDEELTVVEMRPRAFQEQDRLRNVQLLDREVLDGDSLNKLALQYGCKVADIKRVNNLMQEQDLFALKSIKIPVPKHSLLTETCTGLNDSHSFSRPVKLQDRARAQPQLQVTEFLIEVDNDTEKLIQTKNGQDEDFLNNSEKPQQFGFRGQRLTSHGADWGIHWWNALVAMLLIGIVLPLFYVIYFKTKGTNDHGVNISNMSNSSLNSGFMQYNSKSK